MAKKWAEELLTPASVPSQLLNLGGGRHRSGTSVTPPARSAVFGKRFAGGAGGAGGLPDGKRNTESEVMRKSLRCIHQKLLEGSVSVCAGVGQESFKCRSVCEIFGCVCDPRNN